MIMPEELNIGIRIAPISVVEVDVSVWLERWDRFILFLKRVVSFLTKIVELPPTRCVVPIALHIDAVVYRYTLFVRRLTRL